MCCHATVWCSHVGSALKCNHFSVRMLLSPPITERQYLTPLEQDIDLFWFSWEYQNHLIWGKDSQNKILHDNQKIQSCNAALWKGKKEKERERENRAVCLPAPYRGIQSKRTVYLGQLSPKGEFSCSVFNPFSYMVVEDAKP